MGYTNFPNGITSFGIPVMNGSRFSNPWSTHYFVDGDNGNDSNNDGKAPDRAFKTIQKAVTTSTGGDVIYINPKSYTIGTGFARYTEDVVITNGGAGGSGVTATNAGKSLIGVTPKTVASDFMGVRWKYATNTNLNVEAAATHIENIGFFCEGATAGIYFEQDGATWTKSGGTGSSLYNCAIKGEGGVLANGSDSLQIINSQFQAKYDGNVCGMTITIDGTNVNRRPVLRGCHFIGGNGTAMDAAPVIWTGKVEDGLIADNYFHTGTLVQINIVTASSSGLIANNSFAEDDLSTTFIVQNGMKVVAAQDVTTPTGSP
jgi:hypothetical protein